MRVTAKTLDLPPERPSRRRVITFYSYKGGTGRSMALTNVAWMLALNGERVLAIDWDLEAPGLHRYFRPFLKDKELTGTEGLLDFVEKKAARSAVSKSRKQAPERETPKAEPGDKASTSSVIERSAADEAEIIDYLTPLIWPNGVQWQQFGPRARIDLLPAGRQGPAYSRTLNAFNWIDFFERLDGRSILQTAREQLRSVYDYILIDSRTGVSDSSGICTVEMPDTLVVCFTLNDQSIIGAAGITESVLTQRQVRRAAKSKGDDSSSEDSRNNERPFSIFPVPMRVDVTSEHAKRQVALELVQDKFSHFLDDAYRKDLTSYWGSAQMAYYPYYAFEEIPSVFGDTPNVDFSLTNSVKKITGYLTDQAITSLPPLDSDPARAEQKRKEIVGWFARAVGPVDPVALAQAVFDQFDQESRDLMMRVLLRLVHVSPTSRAAKSVPLEEMGQSGRKMVDVLVKHRILNVAGDSLRTVSLSDPLVVEKWPLLNESIQQSQSFLFWRQKLDSLAQTWAPGDSDESALLRGKSLVEAKRRVSDGFGDLNELERNYIEASIQQELRQERIEENARADRERAAQERDRFEKERRAREEEATSRFVQERERFEKERSALNEMAAAREEKALRHERVVWRRRVLYGGIIAIVVATLGGVAFVQNRAKEAQMMAMQQRFNETIIELQKELADNRGSSSKPGGGTATQTETRRWTSYQQVDCNRTNSQTLEASIPLDAKQGEQIISASASFENTDNIQGVTGPTLGPVTGNGVSVKYGFNGRDKGIFGCPGGGHATIVVTFVVQKEVPVTDHKPAGTGTTTNTTVTKPSGEQNKPTNTNNSSKLPTKLWTDSATGLIWAGSDNGENVTWTTADKFCRELRIGNYSSGWRLPKIDELKGIFDPQHDYQYTYHGQPYGGMVDGQNAVNLIKAGIELNSCCAWSAETATDENKVRSAYYYRFQPNPRDNIRNPSIYIETVALIRALCVHDP
jgi:MinD-like ATPase involved in chromosome partitioning or flagellar assembly